MKASRPFWLPFRKSLADDLMASPVAKLGGAVGWEVGRQPSVSSVGQGPAFLSGSFHGSPGAKVEVNSVKARGQAVPATWLGPKPPRIFPRHHLLLAMATLIKHTQHTRKHTPTSIICFS